MTTRQLSDLDLDEITARATFLRELLDERGADVRGAGKIYGWMIETAVPALVEAITPRPIETLPEDYEGMILVSRGGIQDWHAEHPIQARQRLRMAAAHPERLERGTITHWLPMPPSPEGEV